MGQKFDYLTILLGIGLKSFYNELRNDEARFKYFEKVEDFVHYTKNENVYLEDIVVFTYTKNERNCSETVQELEQFFDYFFTVVPTICVIDKFEDISKFTFVAKKYDYVTDLSISDKDIKAIAKFVYVKKKDELDRKKYELINRAVVLDLYEEFIKTGKAVVPAFYYGVDHDGILKTIDDRILKILGFSRDEIIGKRFSELIVNEELEKVSKAFRERRTGERGAKGIVIKLRKKDGGFSEFVVDAQGVHIPTVKEKPQKEPSRLYIGTFGKIKEINNAKNSETTIDFFNVTNEPVFIYVQEEEKLLINRGSEKFLGYKQDEVINKDPSFFEKEEYSYFKRALENLKEKNHVQYATVVVKKSGELINCDVSIDKIKFGEKHYLIGIYRDITDFINFINKADSLIQLTSLMVSSSNKGELIEMASKEIINILDVLYLGIALWDEKKDDFDGVYLSNKNTGEFINEEKRKLYDEFFQIMRKSVLENVVKYSELNRDVINPIGKSNESIKAGDFISVPLIVNEKKLGCMIVVTDYYNSYTLKDIRMMELSGHVLSSGIYRYELENRLKKNLNTLEKRVKERTKELEEFVYTISHDLKSPLYAAKSFAEIIKEQLSEKFKSEEDSYILKRIGENIEVAIRMIDDLLSLSRVGTAEMKIDVIDLNDIINEYLLQFKAVDKSKVKLVINLSETAVPIYGDKGRLLQLFTNLFNNSVKYRKDNEVVINVSSERLNGTVKIVVEDNGIGIEKDEIDKIFKVFYRGRAALERKVEGSGCGLSIVKKIIDMHNGTINVESKPNEGTRFIIELPISFE